MDEATVITWLNNDYYDVLDVPRDATPTDISRAYRRQTRVHHPDTAHAAGRTSTFLRVQEAYEVLGRPETREQYDEVHRVAEHFRTMIARRSPATARPAPVAETDAWIPAYASRLRVHLEFTYPATTLLNAWRAFMPWNPWLGCPEAPHLKFHSTGM